MCTTSASERARNNGGLGAWSHHRRVHRVSFWRAGDRRRQCAISNIRQRGILDATMPGDRRGPLVVGALTVVMGAVLFLAAGNVIPQADEKFGAPRWTVAIFGLAFFFAGWYVVSLALPTPRMRPALGSAAGLAFVTGGRAARSRTGSRWDGADRRPRGRHEVLMSSTRRGGYGGGARISVRRRRPCWHTAQRAMSRPVRRSIRAWTDSPRGTVGAGGGARSSRQRASLAWRVRLARRPKWRMRTKPLERRGGGSGG